MSEYWALWQETGVELSQALVRLPLELPAARNHESSFATQEISQSLAEVRETLGDCHRCPLSNERKHLVFGEGSDRTDLVFVATAPDEEDDLSGVLYSGRAGALLEKMIQAMGRSKGDVYLTTLVKCRPPQDRLPHEAESEQCFPFLKSQIQSISPRVLVALGSSATHALLRSRDSISDLRGKFHSLSWNSRIQVMPTYDPGYLLRNAGAKREVWEDLKQVIGFLKGDQSS